MSGGERPSAPRPAPSADPGGGPLLAAIAATTVALGGPPAALVLPGVVVGAAAASVLRRWLLPGGRPAAGSPIGRTGVAAPAIGATATILCGAPPLLSAAAGVAALEAVVLLRPAGFERTFVLTLLAFAHLAIAAASPSNPFALAGLAAFVAVYAYDRVQEEAARGARLLLVTSGGRGLGGGMSRTVLGAFVTASAIATGLALFIVIPRGSAAGAAPAAVGSRARGGDGGTGSIPRDGAPSPSTPGRPRIGLPPSGEVLLAPVADEESFEEAATLRLSLLDGRPVEPSLPTYVRGFRCNRFAGGSWTRPSESLVYDEGDGSADGVTRLAEAGGPLLVADVAVALQGVMALLAPGEPAAVEAPRAFRDELGNARLDPAAARYRLRYAPAVRGEAVARSDRPRDLAPEDALLEVPESLRPLAQGLAREMGGEGAPLEVALRLQGGVRSNRQYALDPGDATPDEQVRRFLLGTGPGYCVHFATALTLLLRARGIPARLALGLHGGERLPDGAVLFRSRDAHAWVEVPFVEAGWVVFDPTPPPSPRRTSATDADADTPVEVAEGPDRWDAFLRDFDPERQRWALGEVGRAIAAPSFLAAAGALLLAALLALFRRRGAGRSGSEGPRSRPPEPDFLRRMERLLQAHGIIRRPAETLREVSARVAPANPTFQAIVRLHDRLRYGAAPPTPVDQAELLDLVRRFVGEA